MMLRLSNILFLLIFSQSLFAQLQIDWQQCFCSMDGDIAYDITQTEDGYLVLGIQWGGDGQVTCTDDGSTWLLNIDNTGNLRWQKCYDHIGGYRMEKAIGSQYYYLTGATVAEPYPNAYNVWVGKMNSSGVFIWEKTLGNDNGVSDYLHYGVSTNDGGFVAIADIYSQGGDITNWYGSYDGWIVKLDSLGNKEWDYTIGTANLEYIIGITQTNDNGYIAAAAGRPDGTTGNINCTPFTSYRDDAIMYKLDSLGNHEWHKCYGGSENDALVRILSLDDGYLAAGYGKSNDGDLTGSGWHGGIDIWLIRTDLYGEIIWQKCYGGSNNEGPERIFQTSDGGFMVFGVTQSFDGDVVGNPSNSSAKSSIWIIKVDSTGELLWQQCIGGHASEKVFGVIQNGDYDYTVAGKMDFSPSYDVNCSNFIYGSFNNYWVFGISDTTVNVPETLQINDRINIYPIPAKAVLNIDFPDDYNIQNTIIEIVDINGRTMLKMKPISNSTQLDIKRINNGLYVVKIQNERILITKKVIVQ